LTCSPSLTKCHRSQLFLSEVPNHEAPPRIPPLDPPPPRRRRQWRRLPIELPGNRRLFHHDDGRWRHDVQNAIVLGDRSILCAHLESDEAGGGWIGLGISPSGEMDSEVEGMKSTGIIGLPEEGTVMKYWLDDDDVKVDPMDSEKQTLMDASITVEEDGKTIMTFAKYLEEEDDEFVILAKGENPFLYAYGTGPSLGYHASRGSFLLDFDMSDDVGGGEEGTSSPSSGGGGEEPIPSPVPEGTTSTSSSSGGIATMMGMARSMVLGAGIHAALIGM
jgi:hypothetical protein